MDPRSWDKSKPLIQLSIIDHRCYLIQRGKATAGAKTVLVVAWPEARLVASTHQCKTAKVRDVTLLLWYFVDSAHIEQHPSEILQGEMGSSRSSGLSERFPRYKKRRQMSDNNKNKKSVSTHAGVILVVAHDHSRLYFQCGALPPSCHEIVGSQPP